MGLTSKFNPKLCKKLFIMYERGDSPGKICINLGISKHNYESILKKYPKDKEDAMKIRMMNRQSMKEHLGIIKSGTPLQNPVSYDRTSPEEKVKLLKDQLARQRKKNVELEKLLKIAKAELGKF